MSRSGLASPHSSLLVRYTREQTNHRLASAPGRAICAAAAQLCESPDFACDRVRFGAAFLARN